jgi:hypothetical protein
MPRLQQLRGIPAGSVDAERGNIRFDMVTAEGRTLPFVATYGDAAQVAASLARLLAELRRALEEKKGTATVAVEKVTEFHVQGDPGSGFVLVQMMTQNGVPYSFAMPAEAAAALAAKLGSESVALGSSKPA